MKTRIVKREYADGTVFYDAEYFRHPFDTTIWKDFFECINGLNIILLFVPFVAVYFVSIRPLLGGYRLLGVAQPSLILAQQEVDRYISAIQAKEDKRKRIKLSKKLVKKTKIKHP